MLYEQSVENELRYSFPCKFQNICN